MDRQDPLTQQDAPPLPTRPEDVPAVVDDALVRAVLLRGRPPERAGAAPETVLTVHGLGHDRWDFGPLTALCPPDLSIVNLELPGFGPARLDDAAPTTITMADLKNAVLAAAKALPRPPVVCASSLGGHAALMAALEEPGLFAGLALLSPGGLVEVPSALQATLRAYYSVDAILNRPDDEIVKNSRRIFVRAHPQSDLLATRKLTLHRAARALKLNFATPFASICDDVFRHPVLAHIEQLRGLPITVLFGDGDVVVPLSSGRALEARAGAKLTILDRTGHCPHLEDAPRTADIVFGFAHRVFA